MKKLVMTAVGGMLLLAAFPSESARAAEQTDGVASTVTAPNPGADVSTSKDDYSALEKDLKQNRLADALERIQILEQDVRFLRRRVEMLERDVNDIKNDRYNRTNP